MSTPIEDYAVIGNCRTAALISRDGNLDWLCLPRFDSASVFAALLGGPEQGRWSLRPHAAGATSTRSYDGDSFELVTRWVTPTGVADVIEAMPVGDATVIRRVVGIDGVVDFATEVRLRFDYARAIPWVRQVGSTADPVLRALAGPDAVEIRGLLLHGDDLGHVGRFEVRAGERRDLVLTWWPSHRTPPAPVDVDAALRETQAWWGTWAGHGHRDDRHGDLVARSLLTLRALTDVETGGIVAAATTSLPESVGGSRNWDYRYVWLRDAALTLEVLIDHGYVEIAHHWRDWLLRAVAGDPAQVQIMYGVAGERDLPERELTALPGYAGSSPVRIGNAAVGQFQGDVIGEVLVALERARSAGVTEDATAWSLQRALLAQAIERMHEPDQGMWEMRGDPRHFTHSKVMLWAALDAGIAAVETHGLTGDVERWSLVRAQLESEIDTKGYDAELGHFVQCYGSTAVDASLLLLPQVGYCAPEDPRMLRTVAKIEQELIRDGFVLRYRGDDGVSGAENPFLACTLWLAEQYARTGRTNAAEALVDAVAATASDVGLFSEEYDPSARRQTGNVPQAFSHVAFVRAVDALGGRGGRRGRRGRVTRR